MEAGLIGGVIGTAIGIAGGIIGTYFSIKNTQSVEERKFMIRASVAFWLFGGLFITLLITLPSPYKWLLWVPYGILLPFSILFLNKKLKQIREKNSKTPDTSL